MKMLPLRGSTAKTLFFQKISTAFGGSLTAELGEGEKPTFLQKIFDRLRRST
jgi:hypothetical protein